MSKMRGEVMPSEWDGNDRRAYDSTAREMASDARNRADAADRQGAIIGARLDAHLASCEKSNVEVAQALKNQQKLLWGVILIMLGGAAVTRFMGMS
jgi:hypothetical protein